MIDRGPRVFKHYVRCDDPTCEWNTMPAFTDQIEGAKHYHHPDYQLRRGPRDGER